MVKKKKPGKIVANSKFEAVKEILVDGFTIQSGDLIKIRGQYGSVFIFQELVTNIDTGVQWIDCIQLEKGQPGPFRSFYLADVKRIPKRRKSVNRTRPS
jgi:hypothetical protein